MIHLDLQPDLEAQLAAEAHAQGIALDHYLVQIVVARAELATQVDQQLLDRAAEANAHEGIRQGLDQLHRGEGRPAKEFFDELRREYALPR